jgi:hypothetical protein
MPVSDTTPEVSYVGNGTSTGGIGETAYAIPFRFDADSYVKLYVDGVLSADGITVSGAGDEAGGSATTTVAYLAAQRVTFIRESPVDQLYTYADGDRRPASTVIGVHDDSVMQIQEVSRDVGRSLKSAPGDTPPGGSLKQTALTTIGQDAQGNIISRTPAEEVTHLGIEAEVTAAAAAAAAAAASESAASSSESAAAASEAVATAAEALLETIVGNVFASRTFIFSLLEAPAIPGVFGKVYVGNTTYNFHSDGNMLGLNVVRYVSDDGNPYLFTLSEAAEALAQIINGDFSTYEVELDPSSTLLTGAHTEVTAIAEGANLIVSSKLQGTAGNGFTVNTGPAVDAGAWVGDTLLGGQDGQLPVLTYNSIPEIPDRLFGIVSDTLYFQLP